MGFIAEEERGWNHARAPRVKSASFHTTSSRHQPKSLSRGIGVMYFSVEAMGSQDNRNDASGGRQSRGSTCSPTSNWRSGSDARAHETRRSRAMTSSSTTHDCKVT